MKLSNDVEKNEIEVTKIGQNYSFLPASCVLHARPARPKITLRFPHLCICASALIMCAIITSCTLLPCMRPYFSQLQQFRLLLCIASCYEQSTTVTTSRWIPRSRGHAVAAEDSRGARRRAALPCFSPANSELFIAMNSPDNSLLLSWLAPLLQTQGGLEPPQPRGSAALGRGNVDATTRG